MRYDSALAYRDSLVNREAASDPALLNYQQGNYLRAAAIDCAENLLFGAVTQTILGLGIIVPYFSVARQGWVGGIVSVDSKHKSRLTTAKSTIYYLIVLLLQFMPYSLTIGAGIRFGLGFYAYNRPHHWLIWKYGIPKAELADLGRVYILAIPLFFMASCVEFLSGWNH